MIAVAIGSSIAVWMYRRMLRAPYFIEYDACATYASASGVTVSVMPFASSSPDRSDSISRAIFIKSSSVS